MPIVSCFFTERNQKIARKLVRIADFALAKLEIRVKIEKGSFYYGGYGDFFMETQSIYVNRELSWLKFNERVLEESMCAATPL